MKALMLLEIFKLSNKNTCKVESIEFKNNTLNFYIRNNSEKKITEFIKDLTDLKKYNINSAFAPNSSQKHWKNSHVLAG